MAFGLKYKGQDVALDVDRLVVLETHKTAKIKLPAGWAEWVSTRKEIDEHKDELIDLVFEDLEKLKEQMLKDSVLKQAEMELKNSKAILKGLRGE